MTRTRVAVDAMGGDHAPEEVVAGSVHAASALGVEITLVGPAARLTPLLRAHGATALPIEILDAPEVIAMDESPAMAVRKKRRSSIHLALREVRDGRAAAAVSAGNTGATMGAALLTLGRIAGIERPALAAILPTLKKAPGILLDAGANVDCKPRHLLQFALMGHVYAHRVLGIPSPRAGLLSNGEEATKGNELAMRAAELLRDSGLNFVGNIEPRDFIFGQADIVVCDGFVGNVVLKAFEGVGLALRQLVKDELTGPRGWLLALYLIPMKQRALRIWRRMDYREHGGALLLGVNGVVIIAHGRSNAWAVRNAIRMAAEAASGRIIGTIAAELAQIEQRTRPLPVPLAPRPTAETRGADA